MMTSRRNLGIGGAFVVAILGLGLAESALERASAAQSNGTVQAPRFEVDPFWPKPLPNNWVLGETIGLGIDAQDHVWIVHRRDRVNPTEAAADENPPAGTCCSKAPPVLEFDPAGNLVGHWGGPGEGYEWPLSNHGIFIDYKDNVWIGGNGAKDAHILKFTQQRQIPDADRAPGEERRQQRHGELRPRREDLRRSQSQRGLRRRRLRQQARRGHRCRHREVQALLGRVRQQAGRRRTSAATTRPHRPRSSSATRSTARSCRTTACVYVCDRPNDRIQVFKQGRQVREGDVHREARRSATDRCGTSRSRRIRSRSISTSPTARTRRSTSSIANRCEILTSFGDGGRQPGQFFAVHSIATDSKGNIFTTETYEGTPPAEVRVQGHRARREASRASSGQSSVRLQPHHRR